MEQIRSTNNPFPPILFFSKIFPSLLKTSKIIPIYKREFSTRMFNLLIYSFTFEHLQNYKILDRLMYNRLYSVWKKESYFHSNLDFD